MQPFYFALNFTHTTLPEFFRYIQSKRAKPTSGFQLTHFAEKLISPIHTAQQQKFIDISRARTNLAFHIFRGKKSQIIGTLEWAAALVKECRLVRKF